MDKVYDAEENYQKEHQLRKQLLQMDAQMMMEAIDVEDWVSARRMANLIVKLIDADKV